MKLLLLLIFSLTGLDALGASCCVSNTGFSNLMILPAKWQQTFIVSQSRVIGDVDPEGNSVFRSDRNKDTTNAARLDLAYSWTSRYQTGLSFKYQNRDREFQGDAANHTGWSDVGVSHALQAPDWKRIWFFQTLNIPTANSTYNSRANLAVDAHGSGTYQLGQGVISIFNFKEWDLLASAEAHYSFGRTFRRENEEVEVSGAPGGGILIGAGYIPWRSKTRYGLALNPRYEDSKTIKANGLESKSDSSIVWDTSVNITHTFNSQYSLGVNYIDQTLFGPARNTLLVRSIGMSFQSRFE